MFSRRRFLWSSSLAGPALLLQAQQTPGTEANAACPDTTLPKPMLALQDRRGEIVPITTDERENRLERARELMKQYATDAVVITTGASLRYFAGVNWGQSERLFAYVIPRSAAPFLVAPSFERDRIAEALGHFPERETTLSFLWNENEDPFNILRRALAEVNITTGTVGLEEKVPFGMANRIALAAPALKVVSATPVTAGCRSIKSPAEIALLRLANHITLDVYKAVYLSCGPGDTNHKFEDLVAKGYERCGVQGNATCNAGPASASPHGSAKPQTIHEHEVVMVDDGCTVEGYTSDITRSFVYGTPTDEQRMIFETVLNAQSAALAAARPGAEMQQVDQAARKVIEQAGYGPDYKFFLHRVGHGIGLDMHEWPYLVGGNHQKLMPGMVFSDEPGIYLPGKFGLRLEDDMLITENGAELFTPQSPSLQDPFSIPAKLPPNHEHTPAAQPAPLA